MRQDLVSTVLEAAVTRRRAARRMTQPVAALSAAAHPTTRSPSAPRARSARALPEVFDAL
jgi:hypothetical protein